MSSDVAIAKRPLRADAQRNYDRILEVAAEAFAESGAHASLDDIACRAGVGPGTLYRHFPNRECLLAAALDESWTNLHRYAEELDAEPDAGRALRSWMVAVARHMGGYGGLPESVADALRNRESPLGQSCSLAVDATGMLLARAQEAGVVRADVTSDDLLVIANSLAWAAEKKGRSLDDVPRLLDIFLAGLR
jgi:AcrR family transcriptional regulator